RPTALWRTWHSPAPGGGTFTSSHCRTSGPPVLLKRIACVIGVFLELGSPTLYCRARLARLQHLGDKALQLGADALELAAMGRGELCEDLPAARRKLQLHLAPVRGRHRAPDEPLLHEAIDEAHGAVVLDEELASEIVDADREPLGARAQ